MLRGVGVNEHSGDQRREGLALWGPQCPGLQDLASVGSPVEAGVTGRHRPPQGMLVSHPWPMVTMEECRPKIALTSREVRNADLYVKSTHFKALVY